MPPWLLVVLALSYFALPVDLIPDVIPLLGWADDLGVIAFVAQKLANPAKIAEDETAAASESETKF